MYLDDIWIFLNTMSSAYGVLLKQHSVSTVLYAFYSFEISKVYILNVEKSEAVLCFP